MDALACAEALEDAPPDDCRRGCASSENGGAASRFARSARMASSITSGFSRRYSRTISPIACRSSAAGASTLLQACQRHTSPQAPHRAACTQWEGTRATPSGRAVRRPSPSLRRVGSRVARFEDCSAFTHVPACLLAEPPNGDPSYQSASTYVVTSVNRSGCFQPKRQGLGGYRTHWDDAHFYGALSDAG